MDTVYLPGDQPEGHQAPRKSTPPRTNARGSARPIDYYRVSKTTPKQILDLIEQWDLPKRIHRATWPVKIWEYTEHKDALLSHLNMSHNEYCEPSLTLPVLKAIHDLEHTYDFQPWNPHNHEKPPSTQWKGW